MAYLSPCELDTHLRQDNLLHIARQDETLILVAIDTAIAEARGYLAAFDRDRIFTAEGHERNALLLALVKDIAVWHFIKVCNGGVDLEYRKALYDRAIDWLSDVQRGRIQPDLPRIDADHDGNPDPGDIYIFGSNLKRKQHF